MAFRSLLILLLFLLLPIECVAAGKVVIVSVNRTNLCTVATDQSLAPWLVRGAVALVNISTAARPTAEHIYVTLGAGSRAAGTDNTRLAFNAAEEWTGLTAREIYPRHQGAETEAGVLHLAFAEIAGLNRTFQHPVTPGLLGDTLRSAGLVTAVIGNADGQSVCRESVAFLADSSGRVNLGDVSRSILKKDPRFPFGLRTDRNQAWLEFSRLWPSSDVILVDWGDTVRLDEYRTLLRTQVAENLQEEIFSDLSWFLTSVFPLLSPQDTLIILAPAPPAGESGGGLLSYIAVLGGRFPPGSLLSSATTRRPGIVAAVDVAPLILDNVGLSVPGGMVGRPVGLATPGGTAELLGMQRQIDRVFRLRPPLMKTYVFFQIIFVLGALLNFFIRIIPIRRFEAPLLALLVVPVVLLYLPLHTVSVPTGFALTVLAAATVVILLHKFVGMVAWLAVVGVATSISLTIDLLRNASLMKVSVLGYDSVSGARFYGLGNEYMGVLVGSSVLAVTALLTLFPRWQRWLLPLSMLYFLGLVIFIVLPAGGANFGGMVTAFTAFIVTAAVLGQFRLGWRSAAAGLLAVVLIAGIAVLLNVFVAIGDQSHLGRTLAMVERDGWQALSDVASRKAAMNVRLFRYSQWSRAFLAFLTVLAVLFYRPRGVLRDIHRNYPKLTAGFLGIIAGSAAAFLANDSGVVAAATTLLYAGVPIILFSGRIVETT
jgi:hypothetical protein